MAQGMHGGSLDWSLGVISSKQWSWKMCPQGKTATAGGIGGWNMCPSGAYETSLLHIRHLSPLIIGDPLKPAKRKKTFSNYCQTYNHPHLHQYQESHKYYVHAQRKYGSETNKPLAKPSRAKIGVLSHFGVWMRLD